MDDTVNAAIALYGVHTLGFSRGGFVVLVLRLEQSDTESARFEDA